MPVTRNNLKFTLAKRMDTIKRLDDLIHKYKNVNPTRKDPITGEFNIELIPDYSLLKANLTFCLTNLQQEHDLLSTFYDNQELTEMDQQTYDEMSTDTYTYLRNVQELLDPLEITINYLLKKEDLQIKRENDALKQRGDHEIQQELHKMELTAREINDENNRELKKQELKNKEMAIKAKTKPKLPEIPLPQFWGESTKWFHSLLRLTT